jgi:AraC-like DNA-binding protein/mannose-6-phosphate isomerase-like protein (cupin superfamily)
MVRALKKSHFYYQFMGAAMENAKFEHGELEYIGHIKEAPIMFRIVSFESSSPHWHYEYEAFFVLWGTVNINCEAGKFHLEKGDILLLNSREVHAILAAGKKNLCLIMQWSPALLMDVYDSQFHFALNTKGEDYLSPENMRLFRRSLVEIGLLLHEKPDGYQFAIKSSLYWFISLLFSLTRYTISGHEESKATKEHLENFDLIQRYIRDHFKEDMSIDNICSEVAMSRAKLFRIIKASGSNTVKDIQKFYRVEYAKNLLVNSNLSIPYIAAESGFESEPSFYRVFKQFAGISPNQYRTSPKPTTAPMGVQGYTTYQPAEAVRLLKEYRQHDNIAF